MALLIFHSSCIGYVLSLVRMGFHGTFKLRQDYPLHLAELIFCHIVQVVDKGLQPFTISDKIRTDMQQ